MASAVHYFLFPIRPDRDRAAPASQTTKCQALPDRTLDKGKAIAFSHNNPIRRIFIYLKILDRSEKDLCANKAAATRSRLANLLKI